MITDDLVQEVAQLHADICSALADPRRILILYALVDQSRNVSDLAVEVGISQPAASRHLNILRERGLVNPRREGHSVIYQLADERIIQALDLLRAVLGEAMKTRSQLAQAVMDIE